jgi:hypothetical protein
VGESYALSVPGFNGSVRVEVRPERLTSDAGALLVREGLEKLGLRRWLETRLHDPRDADRTTHPLIEQVTTSLLLLAQGWRDQDDADKLRNDPVLRLAVSSRRGTSPLDGPALTADGQPVRDGIAHGLASQPTLSRALGYLASERNRTVLREALVVGAGRRIRAMHGARKPVVTVDVDSLPVEVHGHQDGSAYNGHYHRRMYHPLVASLGGLGDLVDVRLREGNAHTAEGALDFILPLLDRLEREVCEVAAVRIDAGFPCESLLHALEERERPVHYVARIRNNAALNRMAEPHVNAVPPCPAGAEPGMWLHELTYKAGTWSRERRVVLVVQQKPGELLAHHFWLLTSYDAQDMPAADLLGLYRQRGSAEDLMGQWMSTLEPALSSARRLKSHYRGQPVERRAGGRDAYAANEATLLLSALAYNAMHVVRALVERATGRGWRLTQVRERVLKVAARVLVHARRVNVVVAASAAGLWSSLWREFGRLTLPALATASK